MNDKPFFLDTNILIYAYSNQEPEKREIALRLLTSGEVVTSVQIHNEFCNVMRLKFPKHFAEVELALQEINNFLPVFPLTFEITVQTVAISKRYRLSFYDSLVIAAASELNCQAVLSEDLQDGFTLEEGLMVLNSFLQPDKSG